ncbi:hypothetical protein SETIT_3G356800v2 [Setaria italica]|uniref:Uncharacterized protein n=1 Tax=Setaria italica TaxID=4555 RepID=A0A368QM91_SETIT|nr:hypothetical protein SETIT_3G356800v2 [Setaria italica]
MQVDPPSAPAPPAVTPTAPPIAPVIPPLAPTVERKGGSGRKRKQSHIGSALEGYVESKKSQTNKTLQAFEERKRREKEFSVEKCVNQVVSMVELIDEQKSYALNVFESDTHRKIFITTKNFNEF